MNNQEVRTPLRYLVIGSIGYSGVESVDWLEGELPNLIDYDYIIIDVPALSLDRLGSVDLKRFDRIKSQLVRFLDSHGTLIVITSPQISHKRPNRYPEVITNYIWSPIGIGTRLEKGKSIVTKGDKFNNYLRLLSDWDYLFFIPNDCLSDELTNFYGPTNTTRYRIPCIPILENRNGDVLAGRYHIEGCYGRTKSGGYSGSFFTEYPKDPDFLTGDIILLPRTAGLDNRKAVSLILQEITGIPQQTLSPEWADKLIIPRVPDLLVQIERKRHQIRSLETEIAELNQEVDNLNEYKRLLYSTGTELENIVERCFKELEGRVIPAKYSQEEFVLIYGGNEYLVEVKGVSKSVALSHLRQLMSYLLKYQEDTGKSCKGILFGNAWRTLPPQDRDKPNTLVFPDNVKNKAEKWDIALVSSEKFFESFIYFLEHGQGDSILTAITEQKGIILFPVA
jgi:hypothetical protein